MVRILKSRTQETHQASAKVVDGKLILSFPDALRPVLWQMDFSQVKTSALEVSEATSDEAPAGSYVLMLKTPKGDTFEIAPFANREQAVQGLVAATKALENAHGNIRPIQAQQPASLQDNHAPYAAAPKKKRWWPTILISVILVFVFLIWLGSLPQQVPADGTLGGPSVAGGSSRAIGVPMSADDFLNAQ